MSIRSTRERLGMLALSVGLAAMSHTPAVADDLVTYRLTKGQQFQLCRDLEANLRSWGPQSPGMCEIPINPAFERLRAIEWEDLDPLAHWDLFLEVLERRLQLPKHQRDKPAAIANKKQREEKVISEAEQGEIGFGRASFDLNHDGVRDIVYRIGRAGCRDIYPEPTITYRWAYTVLPRGPREESLRQIGRRFLCYVGPS